MKKEIKAGQVWKTNSNNKIVVTFIRDLPNVGVDIIFNDGSSIFNSQFIFTSIFSELIATYPTWQEAVNSPEFREGAE